MATIPMNLAVRSDGGRLVWVLNHSGNDYTEDFKGISVTIPAYNKKVSKHFLQGGNLMPFLEARQFLGQPKATSNVLPDGTYLNQPKTLRTEELTKEESEKILGMKDGDFEKAEKDAEKKAKAKLTRELKKNDNVEPIEEAS